MIVLIAFGQKLYNRIIYKNADANLNITERTFLNYRQEAKEAGAEFNIPPEYLLALIALECGGMKEINERFEKHIFEKLQKLKEGKIEQFEGIVTEDIVRSEEGALQNLASSWGPFQLMGYQCLHLDIKIKQLRGKRSVYYGAKWIRNSYGDYIDKKRFKDAFHLHNTGKKYPKFGPPKTHNRYYVPNGMKYMKEFSKLLSMKEKEEHIH